MAFTNIPNGNLQVGAPLRSVDILALRDNIPAVMNGDTGAPKIKAAAFEGQSGAAPVFAARAWVNFNGFGAAVIRASGNVSSVVRNSPGIYTINFANAMPDINYCFSGQLRALNDGDPGLIAQRFSTNLSTGSFQIVAGLRTLSPFESQTTDTITLSVFR